MQKIRVVLDVAIAADSNIRKKEQEKIGNYQRLKEHLEQMWKSKVIPVVIRGLHPGECSPGNNLQPALRQEIYVNMYLLIVGRLYSPLRCCVRIQSTFMLSVSFKCHFCTSGRSDSTGFFKRAASPSPPLDVSLF